MIAVETTARHGVRVGAVVRAESELGVGRPLVPVLPSQYWAGQTEPNYPGLHDLRQVSLDIYWGIRALNLLVLELINY